MEVRPLRSSYCRVYCGLEWASVLQCRVARCTPGDRPTMPGWMQGEEAPGPGGGPVPSPSVYTPGQQCARCPQSFPARRLLAGLTGVQPIQVLGRGSLGSMP